MCDTYNMGTETLVGYTLVRVGVRGRAPTLHTRAPEDLTTRQKYDLRYREKHRAKLLAYHREYYRKKRTQCTFSSAGMLDR